LNEVSSPEEKVASPCQLNRRPANNFQLFPAKPEMLNQEHQISLPAEYKPSRSNDRPDKETSKYLPLATLIKSPATPNNHSTLPTTSSGVRVCPTRVREGIMVGLIVAITGLVTALFHFFNKKS
jgi:hypothetical protein